MKWAAPIVCLVSAGCGGASLVPADAGADMPAVLSLTVTTTPPSLPGLVLTSGEIELERLGLFGDSDHDDRTEIDRITFQLGAPSQTLVYSMATPGLYSRLRTEIDHIALVGTWNGQPLSILTYGDERVVDLTAPAEELSTTSGAPYSLAIDGNAWIDADFLNSHATSGAVTIDEQCDPEAVDTIMDLAVPSFTVTAP